MSYAGNTFQTRSAMKAAAGRPYSRDRDWAQVGVFGAGIALGALLGAGIALLVAPQSGEETRAGLRRRAYRVGRRGRGAWDELGNELRYRRARRRRRKSRRDELD